MPLIKCPECSKEISDKAEACPHCGFPISKHSDENQNNTSDNYVEQKCGFIDRFEGFLLNKNIICPHCQKRGGVITKPSKKKRGISGGKATGALLTGGLSMLATGLSRKEKVTEARCKNCGAEWLF